MVINTTVFLCSKVSCGVAGLQSNFFVEMPNFDAVTNLASTLELSDLGSTDSHCKELGLITKVDISSKQFLVAHSLLRTVSQQKDAFPPSTESNIPHILKDQPRKHF